MLKHNKKRNTAFLFETLVREVTLNTLSGNDKKRDQAISLLKTFFKKDTEIAKELNLYKSLLETTGFSKEISVRLLEETKLQHRKLDKKKLFEEHSQLIGILNRTFGKDIFLNYVPKYKKIASIAQIFSNDPTPKEKVLLETFIISSMSSKEVLTEEQEDNKDKINNLVLRNFIEKYNTKYSVLSENQKSLLNKFIMSGLDKSAFMLALNEEVSLIKEQLQGFINENKYSEECSVVLAKVELLKEREIGFDEVSLVLETQELIQELSKDQ